jgi:hypothetical protein
MSFGVKMTILVIVSLFFLSLVVYGLYSNWKRNQPKRCVIKIDPNRLNTTSLSGQAYKPFHVQIDDQEYAAFLIDRQNDNVCDAAGQVFCSFGADKDQTDLYDVGQNYTVH